MKKLLAILLCMAFMFTLAACGDKEIDLGNEDDLSKYATEAGAVDVSSDPIAFNYLTGNYDMPEDRVGMRPICISVNNIVNSWPQSGTSKADVIIEMETEYGITRLMCLFDDYRDIEIIGSVRSLRDQFLEAIYPLDPLIVHIGTSVLADRAVAQYGIRTLDGDYVYDSIYIWPERKEAGYATEHTKFTSGQNILDGIETAGLDMEAQRTIDSYFNFVEPGEEYIPASGTASQVTFQYAENDQYDGDLRYDAATGKYQKFQRGQAQMDDYYNTQLAFDNVIVILADVTPVDDSILIEVDYLAGGTAYYFSKGSYEEVTWSKASFESNFEFTRADGTPLPWNTGTTLVSIMRSANANTLVIAP